MEERTHDVATPDQAASGFGVQIIVDVGLMGLHAGHEEHDPYDRGHEKGDHQGVDVTFL